jgi:hypothetical protein
MQVHDLRRPLDARNRPIAVLPDQPGTGGEHQKAGVGATRQDAPGTNQSQNSGAADESERSGAT